MYIIKNWGFDPTGIFTIYNGISDHALDFYDYQQVSMPRKGKYFLTIPAAQSQPLFRIEPADVSLGAFLQSEKAETADGRYLAFHETLGGVVLQYPRYTTDVVLVSYRYAQLAARTYRVDPFYIDRLVTPVPLYDMPTHENTTPRKIGAAFLRKFTAPLPPSMYTQYIHNHNDGSVSLYALSACLAQYSRPEIQSTLSVQDRWTLQSLQQYYTAMRNQRLSNTTH